MERLTFEGNFCDISQCRNVPGGSFCEDGACYQKKVWERLKQFEDTVRAPELFFKMYGELPLLESAIKHYSSHDRMKELAKADKEGRVLVLPCKPGDTVFRVWATPERKPVITEHLVTDWAMAALWMRLFGKTAFLSREEAEKALAEREGKKDG